MPKQQWQIVRRYTNKKVAKLPPAKIESMADHHKNNETKTRAKPGTNTRGHDITSPKRVKTKTHDIIMGIPNKMGKDKTVPNNKDESKSGNKPDTIKRMKVENKNRGQPGNHLPDAE